MLLHLKNFISWTLLFFAIYVRNSVEGNRYERIDSHYSYVPDEEEYPFSNINRAIDSGKREIKLRSFGKSTDNLRTAVGFGKRESKIKKLQQGALRAAIGFGKRTFKYKAQESEPALLPRIPQKEIYPLDWYYEDSIENEPDSLIRIVRKFQDLKHVYEDAAARVDDRERLFPYRNPSNSLTLDED